MKARKFTSRSTAALVKGFIFVAAAALAGAADAASPGTTPDMTVTFRWHAIAVGAGFVWGASSVNYQGKTYPVRVDGFVLGGIGAGSGSAVGEVYGLSKVDDLNGNFTALTAVGGAFGAGTPTAVLRNDKGVRIVMQNVNASGFGVGIGLRAITLAVGQAGGPPAEEGARLPQTLGFGQARFGEKLLLQPTLNVQLVGFAEGNPGFNGRWSAGPVDRADEWFEKSNEFGLNGAYDTGRYGAFTGRVSGIYSMTGGGVDAAASNGKIINNRKYGLEDAYLDWKSGSLLPGLGEDALEISGGNQNYQLYDGFLFWQQQNATSRGANWIAPRKAFRYTGIVRLNLGNLLLEGVHLQYNDDPDTATRLAGGRIEYTKDDWLMKHLKVAAMYFNIYNSTNDERRGLNGVYSYMEGTPLPSLPDFSYTGSFVYETNSKAAGLTNAAGWYIYPSYQFSNLPWKPQLFYRYASFTGGGTRTFDPLFLGELDWGTWSQGEILGEFVLSNSNLNSHQVRLKMQLNDIFTLNLIYYKFSFYNKNQNFGLVPTRVTSDALANEFDTILDINLTNWWSMTVDLNFAVPSKGISQAVNGHSTWISGMIYTNFNF